MEGINIEEVQSFVEDNVEVSIQDHVGEEQLAPFVRKHVVKVGLCPDQTHLRIYFDAQNFFAVPLEAEVTVSEKEWMAFDEKSELYYVIRKVD